MLGVYAECTEETNRWTSRFRPEFVDARRVGKRHRPRPRAAAKWALQALLDADATEKIGSGRYGPSEWVTHRNGT